MLLLLEQKKPGAKNCPAENRCPNTYFSTVCLPFVTPHNRKTAELEQAPIDSLADMLQSAYSQERQSRHAIRALTIDHIPQDAGWGVAGAPMPAESHPSRTCTARQPAVPASGQYEAHVHGLAACDPATLTLLSRRNSSSLTTKCAQPFPLINFSHLPPPGLAAAAHLPHF